VRLDNSEKSADGDKKECDAKDQAGPDFTQVLRGEKGGEIQRLAVIGRGGKEGKIILQVW